jgi:hypothetical protein
MSFPIVDGLDTFSRPGGFTNDFSNNTPRLLLLVTRSSPLGNVPYSCANCIASSHQLLRMSGPFPPAIQYMQTSGAINTSLTPYQMQVTVWITNFGVAMGMLQALGWAVIS